MLRAFVLALLSVAAGAGLTNPDDAAADSGRAPAPTRLIMWADCELDVVSLTNSDLDRFKAMGVDGFVCMTDRLWKLGGDQKWTASENASLAGPRHELQRRIRDSKLVQRAARRRMKLYLGLRLTNYFNTQTPLLEWFDDRGWSQRVLPEAESFAAAAHSLGFAGIAIDQEMYAQRGGVTTATWNWDYPGGARGEAEVRPKARERGQQLMRAFLRGFPRAQFAVYGAFFPGDWRELVQEALNGVIGISTRRLDVDFWDGMTSVLGFRAIRFFDSTFYKTPHRGNWTNALTYNQNSVYATFSREFSAWDTAWRRVHVSPFSWIDEGPNASDFDDARPPAYVGEQLQEFRKWAAGGEIAGYAYGALRGFDYGPYSQAMQTGSAPGAGDSERPTLQILAGSPDIRGVAHDNLAIRAVRWRDDRGRSGVAALEWRILSGDYDRGYEWETTWSIPAGAVSQKASRLEVRAIDIKGNDSSASMVNLHAVPAVVGR